MILDVDDHHSGNDAMPWMVKLKELNPAFKATLFSVPGLGSEEFWRSHPDWVELVPHGWLHPDPFECAEWSKERMFRLMEEPIMDCFVEGWKSPGWQISDATYEALLERGWWVADQHLEDHRRPAGLRTYFYEDGDDRHHHHVQNVCGNGLEETWGRLRARVAAASEFSFASEALSLGPDSDD